MSEMLSLSNIMLTSMTSAGQGSKALLSSMTGASAGIEKMGQGAANTAKGFSKMLVVTSLGMSLLEGFLSPLEPLTSLLGSLGEIFGMLLIPIVQMIIETITPFIPFLVSLMQILAPFVQLFFMLSNPIILLTGLLTYVMEPLNKLTLWMQDFQVDIGYVSAFVKGLPKMLLDVIGRSVKWLFGSIWNIIVALVNKLLPDKWDLKYAEAGIGYNF